MPLLLACVLLCIWGLLGCSEVAFAQTGSAAPPPAPVALTPEERAWLQAHPVIRGMIPPTWEPWEYFDEQGRPHGAICDYLELFERMLGVQLLPVRTPNWAEGLKQLEKGELVFATGLVTTPEREQWLEFTQPYLTFPIAIYTRKDIRFVADLRQLQGRKMAFVRGYVTPNWVRRDYPQIQHVLTDTYPETFRLVADGEVDACLAAIALGDYQIEKQGLDNLKVAGQSPYEWSLRIAIRKDYPLLASSLRKAFKAIPQEEHARIHGNWLAVRVEKDVDPALLFEVVGISLAVLALVLFWNRRLCTGNQVP